jgi:hypothetical protein
MGSTSRTLFEAIGAPRVARPCESTVALWRAVAVSVRAE